MKSTELTLAEESNREGLNVTKLAHFFNVALAGKTAGADAYLKKFTHFDPRLLRELTGKRIKGALIDVDACIAPPYAPIPDENLGHIDNMKCDGLNVGIYSNCKGMDRLWPLRAMGIRMYAGRHAKPSAAGFRDACKDMDFAPDETWMLGDNPLTDGGAVGVLEGVAFVEPIPVDPRYVSAAKRVKLSVMGLFRQLAIARTLSNNTKILRLPSAFS